MAERLSYLLDKNKIKPALSTPQERKEVSTMATDVNARMSLLTSALKQTGNKSTASGTKSVDKTVLSLTTSLSVIASSLKRINDSLSKIGSLSFPNVSVPGAPEKSKEKNVNKKGEESTGGLLKTLMTNPAVLALIGGIGYMLLPKDIRDKVNSTLGAFAQGLSDSVGEQDDKGLKGFKATMITVGALFATYFTASLITNVASAIITATKLVKSISSGIGKLGTKKGKAAATALGLGLGATAYGASKLMADDYDEPAASDNNAYRRGYESTGKAPMGSGYGSAGPGGKGVGETGSSKEAMEFFMSKGWTKEQAAGIVGNLQAESGANMKTDALGDNGKAYGIAQWHPDRQAKFKDVYGKDIRQSGFKEQLEYVNWELNNTERKAGDRLRQTSTAEEAAAVVDKFYERSSGQHLRNRQANAMALLQGSTQMASAGASAAASGYNMNTLSSDVKKLQTPKPSVDVNNINNSKSQSLSKSRDETLPIPSPIASRGSLGFNTKHTTAYV